MKIRLIATDLDGTLVNPAKQITERTMQALQAAADAGIHIVPTTGRLFHVIPEVLRKSGFVRYGICMNGGQVYDAQVDSVLHRDEIPLEEALQVYEWLERYPVAYDCYVNDSARMERSTLENLGDYIRGDSYGLALAKSFRTPVDGFREHILKLGVPLQKMQVFTSDQELRMSILRELQQAFPSLSVTWSLPYNIEINTATAVKGNALRKLCSHLGIPMEEVAAFGDGTNDITMLQAAGVSVAMANAVLEVKAAARYETASNAEDGVAQFIETYIL